MASHDDTLTAFISLRTSLSALADKIVEPNGKARVSHIAATVGDVTENFDLRTLDRLQLSLIRLSPPRAERQIRSDLQPLAFRRRY